MSPAPGSPFVYLASQSPRRSALLDQVGIAHVVLAADDDEDAEALERIVPGEAPLAYVRRVARRKADAAVARVARRGLPAAPIVVGDTTVALGRAILGKPDDDADARRMLAALSGRTHRVITAVAVAAAGRVDDALSASRVRFCRLDANDIARYVATGEPFGKAGAYAMQGLAAAFVERIAGSHSGIVGLPLFETVALLRRAGVAIGTAAAPTGACRA